MTKMAATENAANRLSALAVSVERAACAIERGDLLQALSELHGQRGELRELASAAAAWDAAPRSTLASVKL